MGSNPLPTLHHWQNTRTLTLRLSYRQFEIEAWDGRWFLMMPPWTTDVGRLGIGVQIRQSVRSPETLQKEYQNAQVETEPTCLRSLATALSFRNYADSFSVTGLSR